MVVLPFYQHSKFVIVSLYKYYRVPSKVQTTYLLIYLILTVKMIYRSIQQEPQLDVSLIEANQKHLQTIKTIRKMTYITHVAKKTSKFVIHLEEALEILEKMLYYYISCLKVAHNPHCYYFTYSDFNRMHSLTVK